MDFQGYERVIEAAATVDASARVFPIPEEGQNVPFVTIQTGAETPASEVLNALNNHGLVKIDKPEGPMDVGASRGPKLKVIGVHLGSLTFEDRGTVTRSGW